MEKKLSRKVSFNKSGTGGLMPRVNLYNEWLTDMGVTIEKKEVILSYNSNTKEITIKKK